MNTRQLNIVIIEYIFFCKDNLCNYFNNSFPILIFSINFNAYLKDKSYKYNTIAILIYFFECEIKFKII